MTLPTDVYGIIQEYKHNLDMLDILPGIIDSRMTCHSVTIDTRGEDDIWPCLACYLNKQCCDTGGECQGTCSGDSNSLYVFPDPITRAEYLQWYVQLRY